MALAGQGVPAGAAGAPEPFPSAPGAPQGGAQQPGGNPVDPQVPAPMASKTGGSLLASGGALWGTGAHQQAPVQATPAAATGEAGGKASAAASTASSSTAGGASGDAAPAVGEAGDALGEGLLPDVLPAGFSSRADWLIYTDALDELGGDLGDALQTLIDVNTGDERALMTMCRCMGEHFLHAAVEVPPSEDELDGLRRGFEQLVDQAPQKVVRVAQLTLDAMRQHLPSGGRDGL